MQNKFHVGEHVKFISDDEFEFEVIATVSTPHVAIDKTIISVPSGSEYILRMLNQQNKFEPYCYALGKNIIKI